MKISHSFPSPFQESKEVRIVGNFPASAFCFILMDFHFLPVHFRSFSTLSLSAAAAVVGRYSPTVFYLKVKVGRVGA